MCRTMGERYPVAVVWHEEQHSDVLHDRAIIAAAAPVPSEAPLMDGVTAIAVHPDASAAIVIVADRDIRADAMTARGVPFAVSIRRGTTLFRKRVSYVYGPLPQTPFGPRAYPWT